MSIARTINVPSISAITGAKDTQTPATLAEALDGPLRVVVRNVGGATVRVGYAANSFIGGASALTDTFVLDPNVTETFVLEVSNKLYAAGLGASVVSVAISPAFPIGPLWGQS